MGSITIDGLSDGLVQRIQTRAKPPKATRWKRLYWIFSKRRVAGVGLRQCPITPVRLKRR